MYFDSDYKSTEKTQQSDNYSIKNRRFKKTGIFTHTLTVEVS